jgi:hypothetical protein
MGNSIVFAEREYMSDAHVSVLAFADGALPWPNLAKPLKRKEEFRGSHARPKP